MASPLISTQEAYAAIGQPRLRFVDATWRLDGTDPRPAFEARRLPGAVFFDLEAVSDSASALPHMAPDAMAFGAAMGALGLSRDDRIVVYDQQGLFSAARAWFMLRAFGAGDVRVLDGGLPRWLAEGRSVENGARPPIAPARFEAMTDPVAWADRADVLRALRGEATVVDARGAARFRGEMTEPRPGVRAGHMPGAINLPFADLMTAEGTMKRGEALARAFTDAGVDLDRPAVTTCGSGVTAAILSLGLAELGRPSRLYDGSWAEWGADPTLPVATGAA